MRRLGSEAADPIEEFLTRALAYEREHAASLQGFLAWLAEGDIEIKRELDRGQGMVRILTVHGAKGLQAPVVILPDTTQLPNAKRPLLWRPQDDLCLRVPVKKHDGQVTQEARATAERAEAEEYRRLLYVALTRAEDRLIVCGWPAHNGAAAEGSWYDLICAGLDGAAEPCSFDFTAEGGWSGQGFRLSLRRKQILWEASKIVGPLRAVAAAPDWLHREPPAEPDPPRPLAPSRPSMQEPAVRSPLGPDQGQGFRRGRLVHRLLETFPDLPREQRADAAERYLALAAGDLSASERAELAAETLAVLEHPQCAALWGAGSLAEVPVVGRVGSRVIAGRIDRLLVEPGRVTILDYKTNRPPPTEPHLIPAAYLDQMAAYRAALGGIYAKAEICCVLLWTDGPRLMQIPTELLDRRLP